LRGRRARQSIEAPSTKEHDDELVHHSRTCSGSCRDIAALFIEAARHLGYDARAVSGYLVDVGQPEDDPGSTHSWAEICLPGAGWIAFDPTHRRVGNANLIPVAFARLNRQIMPVAGGFPERPEDFDRIEVTVKVRRVDWPDRGGRLI